jgi:alkylhydroperoxidase family enzyme
LKTRLPGSTADEIRSLVPAVGEVWAEIETNVLDAGVADQRLKELCFRYLASEIPDVERYSGRERLALEWADAIAHDSAKADDGLWRKLHETFTEPELVDLGCAIGFELGRQHWRRSVGLPGRSGPEARSDPPVA